MGFMIILLSLTDIWTCLMFSKALKSEKSIKKQEKDLGRKQTLFDTIVYWEKTTPHIILNRVSVGTLCFNRNTEAGKRRWMELNIGSSRKKNLSEVAKHLRLGWRCSLLQDIGNAHPATARIGCIQALFFVGCLQRHLSSSSLIKKG